MPSCHQALWSQYKTLDWLSWDPLHLAHDPSTGTLEVILQDEKMLQSLFKNN